MNTPDTNSKPDGNPAPSPTPELSTTDDRIDGTSGEQDDTGFRGLPAAALLSSRIGGLILSTLIGIGASIPLGVLLSADFDVGVSTAVLLALLLVGVLGMLSWQWSGLSHRRTSYRIDDDGWTVRRGVLWRAETLVPRSRVQHVDINHGPIDRHFGLATLKVHTAGTRMEAVSLDGLEAAQALNLRDALLSHDDDAV